MGPGWATPYNLIVVANKRPVTAGAAREPSPLPARDRQRPDGDSVTGPGAINSTSTQLSTFGSQLRHSASVSDQSKKDLLKLINGLGQAGAGSSQLQSGLAAASNGATALQSGSGQAESGAGQLHAGLAQANAGSTQLKTGLDQRSPEPSRSRPAPERHLAARDPARAGHRSGAPGSEPERRRVERPDEPHREQQLGDLGCARRRAERERSDRCRELGARLDDHRQERPSLRGRGRVSPERGRGARRSERPAERRGCDASQAKALASGVAKQAPALVHGLAKLQGGASELEAGIKQLRDGNGQLATGMSQLSTGGGQLTSGLRQLTAGAGALEIGLSQLTSGAGELASGLTSGVGPAGQLISGLGTMQAAVVKARGQIPSTKQLEQLEQQSPGIFNSGYFVLAAVEERGRPTATPLPSRSTCFAAALPARSWSSRSTSRTTLAPRRSARAWSCSGGDSAAPTTSRWRSAGPKAAWVISPG